MTATTEPSLSFFARLALAFRLLFDAGLAAGLARRQQPALPEPKSDAPPAPLTPAPVVLREATPDAAIQLLGLLQREGRFVDFIEEDMSAFTDVQIGAAARVVHEGCRKALKEHFSVEPVRAESEGAKLTLEKGFDAREVRLVGHVVGEPPFRGTLQHRGWRVSEVRLPKLTEGHDVHIVAPAEVEL